MNILDWKKITMNKLMIWGMSLWLVIGVMLGGCDRKIAHEKSVDVDGSEVTTEEKIVTEKSDGRVEVQEKETTVDKAEGTSETESETKTYK